MCSPYGEDGLINVFKSKWINIHAFYYKQHFYEQLPATIGKESNKC